MNRLRLTHLTLIGPERLPATVEFGPRLTVVRGPSDTGKSFIVEAIDFMLGGKRLKTIPERSGYSRVLLGLSLPDGAEVTLSRDPKGGRISVFSGAVRNPGEASPDLILGSKHSAASKLNLSRYLLDRIGLDGRRVRKNVNNETIDLSFRNVAMLCVVDETAMQATTPPALSGQSTSRTAEASVLRLILQDEDDSALRPVAPPKDRRRLADAKSEVVDRILVRLEAQIREISPKHELLAQLGRLNDGIDAGSTSIGNLAETRERINRRLAQAGRVIAAASRTLDEISVTGERFRLLQRKYESDIQRLEMLAEAGTLIGYFNPSECVFCGADADHQRHEDGWTASSGENVGQSIAVELSRTSKLRDDLVITLADLNARSRSVIDRRNSFVGEVGQLNRALIDLDRSLLPRRSELKEMLNVKSAVERQIAVFEEIEELQALKSEIAADVQAEAIAAAEGIRATVASEFASTLSAILNRWGFPDSGQVSYSREEQDILAGNQLRSAHGKGVRAILHAAFTVGLAQYCLDRDLPHPGFVVLDSPLITYRPPERGGPTEAIDRLDFSIADRFYRDLEENFSGQAIVMENMDPPSGLSDASFDHVFTKSLFGRYGFIPMRDGT